MKRFLKYSMILLGLLAVAYIGGLIFFLDRFTFGSYFGDIPLMGLTQAQAQEKIADELGKRQINLQENGKWPWLNYHQAMTWIRRWVNSSTSKIQSCGP